MTLQQVEVRPVAPERLTPLIGEERGAAFADVATAARARLAGRKVVNVNTTATGGGVAELLQMLLAYGRGAGVDGRWLVIDGTPRFFEITKRIHNHLYGTAGDGGPLGRAEHRDYDKLGTADLDALFEFVFPGDIVVLHDPQTAALTAPLQGVGATVVWRCHIGIDQQNAYSEEAWDFIRPYMEDADAFVFHRMSFAPKWIPPERLVVIPPSIDPFASKNVAIEPDAIVAGLVRAGVVVGDANGYNCPFTRRDGTLGHVERCVDMLGTGPIPSLTVPVVLQASRWDRLKDMPGVMRGFANEGQSPPDAHLLLAGPDPRGVADDPEANAVLHECLDAWATLPPHVRERVHLACVPMDEVDEAATIVNVMQRHAAIVVQKSIAEGFGLTVAEAMWKSRPVVGSAVGGIADQILPGVTGELIDDPNDLDAFHRALCMLLEEPDLAREMGERGLERARAQYLPDRHLSDWAALFGAFAAR
jgi:trehalose synthase